MKIEYERTGGFAGLSRRAAIDTDQLPAAECQSLRELVEAAGFFDAPLLPPAQSPAPGADRFHYAITIEDGPRRRTVQGSEASFPEAWQPLLRRLEVLSRG